MRSTKQGQAVEPMHCGSLKRYLLVTFFHFLAVNCFHLDCSTALIRWAFIEEPQVISSIWNNGSVYVLLEKKQGRPLWAQHQYQHHSYHTSPLLLTNSLLSLGQLLQSPVGRTGFPLLAVSCWPPHYSHMHTTFNPEDGRLLTYNQYSECRRISKGWTQPPKSTYFISEH